MQATLKQNSATLEDKFQTRFKNIITTLIPNFGAKERVNLDRNVQGDDTFQYHQLDTHRRCNP